MAMSPRLLRPLATGFNPKSISGLALWLDGADSSSLYTTDAGPGVAAVSSPLDIAGCVGWWDASDATTITESGGLVSQLSDKSGQGNHATASGALRPTLTASGLNGLGVLNFGGTQGLQGNLASSVVSNAYSVFVVCRVIGGITNGRLFSISSAAAADYSSGLVIPCLSNGTNLSAFSGTSGTNVSAVAGFASYAVFGGVLSANQVANAANGMSNTPVAATLSATITKFGICIAAQGGTGLNTADIAEIIYYPSALSPADRARVEAYLAAKWGIANVHAPATAASDPVGYWGDRSGNGRHATQSTAASRPTIGSQNGRRALSANGTSHDMALTNAGGVTRNAPGVTIIAALSPNTVASIRSAVLFSIGTSAAARTLLQFNGAELRAGGRRLDADSFDSATGGTIVANQPIVAVARLDYANANAVAYSNSAPLATDTSFLTAGLVSDTASQASSIMNSSGGFFFYSGIFAELLVYNRALTDAERRKAEIYLARKWGITLAPQVSNADAQDWVNRVYANGGTVSTSTANAVNTFCAAIDTAGIRDRFYRLNLFCGTGLNAALVPLYRNTSLAGPALGNATDTNSGALFVSGDYTEPTGLTGGTNKHLNTGLAPDNMPLGVVQAMALSFSHGPTPNLNTDPRPVGAAAISPVTERFVLILTIRSSVTGVLSSTLGRGNALLSAQIAAGPQPSASWVASRTSATSLVAYKNGIADATLATTVTPIASHALPFFVCRSNEGGVATGSAIALPHRHYSIGAGLTGSEVASYDTALAAFRSAIGRTA
jgi:hypothetical protein